jgi:CDP-paratose 2-epimerase
VGACLGLYLKKRQPDLRVIALDSLRRRGSELQLPRLKKAGIEFVHGDIREFSDLADIKADVMFECSAEPSVSAGLDSSPVYLLQTNLSGMVNCLEWCRLHKAGIIFLSTSRVYPIQSVENIPWREEVSRFVWTEPYAAHYRKRGLSVNYPVDGVRSLYGTAKYAAEQLLREYAACYDIPALSTRFGVIAGPWQMGKVDQGFVSLWVAAHLSGGDLSYNGYGGGGKQVRDILHVDDVCDLLYRQFSSLEKYRGELFQAGGGFVNSLSLRELTELCWTVCKREIDIKPRPETHRNDLRIMLLDSESAELEFGWRARKNCLEVVKDIYEWLCENKQSLRDAGVLPA